MAAYQQDPLYPRIVCAVAAILAKGKVVAPVAVLIRRGLLTPKMFNEYKSYA